MTVNPDNKDYMGPDKFAVPADGMLRFVERPITTDTTKLVRTARMLERWEWSSALKKWDWFEVGLFSE